jgi:hypothetical protein
VRYAIIVLGTFGAVLLFYFGTLIALTPVLIPAEYWVRETMTVKRAIASRYLGQRKIIIGSGSSGLFGVDTAELTRAIGRPVLNLSLHGGLPLETILRETGATAESGDSVILLLEPFYYSRNDPTNWQIRNMIAWDPSRWRTLPLQMRVRYLAHLEPSFLLEVIAARVNLAVPSEDLSARQAAFDDPGILARFAVSPPAADFEYSAFHLDFLGNMNHAVGHIGVIRGDDIDAPTEIGMAQRAMLLSFVHMMRARSVSVFFGHAPLVGSPKVNWAAIDKASASFVQAMADIGPVIDERRQVVFDDGLFFNTDLHLNTEGRRLRTAALLTAIRRHVIEPSAKGH